MCLYVCEIGQNIHFNRVVCSVCMLVIFNYICLGDWATSQLFGVLFGAGFVCVYV